MQHLLSRNSRPQPRLSKEFNGPFVTKSYTRTRDYYDASSLQYLFSVGDGFSMFDPSTSVRLIDSLKLEQINFRFKMRRPSVRSIPSLVPRGSQPVDTAFEADLHAHSTPFCFDEYQGQLVPLFWCSVREKREKSGYILFNRQSKRVYFQEMEVSSSINSANDIYAAGEYYRGNKVLGNVHTHPDEIPYLKQGFTDAQIYDSQYSRRSSDGQTAILRKTSRYTVGRFNVDFFSPRGRAMSKNNITTLQGLANGGFNIYRHALEVYGGKRR